MIQLVLRSTDVSLTTRLVSWTTSPTKDLVVSLEHRPYRCVWAYLEYVQNREIDESTSRAVVDLSTLDDNSMSGQIDTPRQSRSTAKNLSISLTHRTELVNSP
jgi:hypothetical protein